MKTITVQIGNTEELKPGDLLFVYGAFMKVLSVDPRYQKRRTDPREVAIDVELDLGDPPACLYYGPETQVVFQRPEEVPHV